MIGDSPRDYQRVDRLVDQFEIFEGPISIL